MKTSRAKVMELGVVAIVLSVSLLAVWLAVIRQQDGSAPQQPEGRALQPSAVAATETPAPTPTIASPVTTATISVPADAKLPTAEDAVAEALRVAAERFQAPDAMVVAVELMTLEDTLADRAARSGQDVATLRSGYAADELDDLVWRVELGGTVFWSRDTCGETAEGTPIPCGGGTRAIFTMRATDGTGPLELFGEYVPPN